MNSKGQLHGYQELYFGSNLTIRTMCKNGGLVGYLENHYDNWKLILGVRECMKEVYPLNNFEEAESACIDELIERIKNK